MNFFGSLLGATGLRKSPPSDPPKSSENPTMSTNVPPPASISEKEESKEISTKGAVENLENHEEEGTKSQNSDASSETRKPSAEVSSDNREVIASVLDHILEHAVDQLTLDTKDSEESSASTNHEPKAVTSASTDSDTHQVGTAVPVEEKGDADGEDDYEDEEDDSDGVESEAEDAMDRVRIRDHGQVDIDDDGDDEGSDDYDASEGDEADDEVDDEVEEPKEIRSGYATILGVRSDDSFDVSTLDRPMPLSFLDYLDKNPVLVPTEATEDEQTKGDGDETQEDEDEDEDSNALDPDIGYGLLDIDGEDDSAIEPSPASKQPFATAAAEIFEPAVATKPGELPVDKYRDEIIHRVERDRVTIIHGETGCGKSSRLPVILLEHCESSGKPCRMMISQPRRIAASSLMKRLRTTLGEKVGMRMGHGVKDEFESTAIHFVTTGYLVRLLAHHPEQFNKHTHLIIDEVHERSVDGDLLCLLARKLLESNPNIRLILMSATIHTALYKQYFSQDPSRYYGDMECLSVGVRRFPIEIKFVDDIAEAKGAFPSQIVFQAKELLNASKSLTNSSQVPANLPKLQYNLAVSLIKHLGKVGTGILVFVSGIADITDLTEKFEGLDKYKVIAIHSEIPFEEQETAFLPAGPNEVKVIIATNAAESSITLPDVDCVLCLGTHKALQYHSGTHRVHLVNTWVSKASATQRAGRTGRVRPGSVYRLYSKKLHESFGEHEDSEIHRTPLQDVILGLRSMLEQAADFNGVVPILEDLLEPPDTQNVQNSFEFLYATDMISQPNDSGELTSVGRLASQLPVDIQLGRLISFGVNLGVGSEAVIVASALSQPKSLFRVASPLIHTDPDEMNEIIRTTLLGSINLDAGMYSEPMMHIKLFLDWRSLATQQDQFEYVRRHGLAYTRVKSFVTSTVHLLSRVKESLSSSVSASISLDGLTVPSPYKQNMLRLILAWNSEDNILQAKEMKVKSDTTYYTAAVDPPVLTANHLKPLFPPGVAWKLEGKVRKIYDGRFSDTKRTPLQLLTAMLTVSNSLITWLIQQGKKGQAAGTHVIIAIASETPAVPGSRDPDDQAELSAFRTAFRANFADIQEAGSVQLKETYEIFVLSEPSKRQLAWWNEVHDELTKSLSMLIPTEGNAKIRDNNCCLSQSQLQNLFFGRVIDPSQESEEHMKKRYHISEQVLAAKQTIIFPSPFSTGADLESKNTGKKSKQKQKNAQAEASSSKPDSVEPSLITDLPLGLRLLNAYRNIYKDKKMRVWSVPRGLKTSTSTSSLVVPAKAGGPSGNNGGDKPPVGSLEWSRKRLDSQSSLKAMAGEIENADDDDDKLVVNIKAISLSWINMTCFGRLNTNGKPPMALLSRQSPISVAVHCGEGLLYAVAYNSVSIGSDARLVFVEGVSLLPPGSRWLTLALRCIGKNVSNFSDFDSYDSDDDEDSKKGKKGASKKAEKQKPVKIDVDRPLSEADAQKCSLVYELMQRVSKGPICLAPGVVSHLEDLFSDWIGQRPVQSQAQRQPLQQAQQPQPPKVGGKNVPPGQKEKKQEQPRQKADQGKPAATAAVASTAGESVPGKGKQQAAKDNKKQQQQQAQSAGDEKAAKADTKAGKKQKAAAQAAANTAPTATAPATTSNPKEKSASTTESVQKSAGGAKSKEASPSSAFTCTFCGSVFPDNIALYSHHNQTHKGGKVDSGADSGSLRRTPRTPRSTDISPTRNTRPLAKSNPLRGYDRDSSPPAISRPLARSTPHTPDSSRQAGGVFNCEKCDEVFPSSVALMNHRVQFHRKSQSATNSTPATPARPGSEAAGGHQTPRHDASKTDPSHLRQSNKRSAERERPRAYSYDEDDPNARSKEGSPKDPAPLVSRANMCCSLFNSTQGCPHSDCTHLHLTPRIGTSEWEALLRQFKSLTRRPNFAHLQPLPELQFDLTK